MPFTISHVALVLPVARPLARWRLLSATIIGSMVPDFGFLLPWRPARVETHSALSLLTFCLPVGVLCFWVFQRVIKPALMAILPDAAYGRWRGYQAPARLGGVTQWLLAACGILVGSATHLIWDAFTHEGARGVRMIPALEDPAVDFVGHHLAGARLLQDVSSLVGLLVVMAVVAYALRPGQGEQFVQGRALNPRERHLWILVYAAAAVLLACLFFVMRRHNLVGGHSLAIMVGNWAIAGLRGFAAALLLVSVGVSAKLRAGS